MKFVYRPDHPDANENGMVEKSLAQSPTRFHIQREIDPYQSPATGKWITNRRERRDDLARSGCVPYEPLPNAPKGLINTRFAHKHGAVGRLTPEAREKYETERKQGMWR